MAISYPRSLPFDGRGFAAGSDLWLPRSDSVNQTREGGILVAEIASPLWMARHVTRPLKFSQRQVWKAWGLSLRGGMFRFWGHHPIRHYPAYYGASVLDFFDGIATLGTPVEAYAVWLTGLPIGYVASIGDMVSLPLPDGGRSLHMFTEQGVANGSGQLNGIGVEPSIPADVVTGEDVQLVLASCLMAIKWDTFSCPEGDYLEPVSFEAVQALR